MSNKEIFLKILKRAGYKNEAADLEPDFNKKLLILEDDAENVFHAMYGEKDITDRGKKKIREYIYRYGEAMEDLKNNYIKFKLHYLIMQIHTKALTL